MQNNIEAAWFSRWAQNGKLRIDGLEIDREVDHNEKILKVNQMEKLANLKAMPTLGGLNR